MRVYDFKCPSGHIEEHTVRDSDVTKHICSMCGGIGIRQLCAPPFVLEGATGAFPGRAMKWERDHEQAAKRSDHNIHRFS